MFGVPEQNMTARRPRPMTPNMNQPIDATGGANFNPLRRRMGPFAGRDLSNPATGMDATGGKPPNPYPRPENGPIPTFGPSDPSHPLYQPEPIGGYGPNEPIVHTPPPYPKGMTPPPELAGWNPTFNGTVWSGGGNSGVVPTYGTYSPSPSPPSNQMDATGGVWNPYAQQFMRRSY